ncbi:DUF1003 domain-containing protein [Mucilaginibacter ginkgonis]|uniref:DUF1003 domain-containing protein n=1 Tax=Mucilaginibacter ginkgonis TaxID=2682091 RepID=A0A6I4HWL7_9SPHI|nr:DUF1003 domain-containing protein [Mucilaginibacter ginkgonis]QQL51263.1 DUF1003 domain-containing protein [Mucilaginibacter ginkgonis]
MKPKYKSRKTSNEQGLKSEFQIDETKADRIAIAVSDALGNFAFLMIICAAIAIYILFNVNVIPGVKAFDPAPFNIMDSVLSVFALILTITILISQGRQRRLEKIREEVEFEINVRAEHEITKVLTMLHDIQTKLGIATNDADLEEMKQGLDLDAIKQKVKDKDALSS